MFKVITSIQNPVIRNILLLQEKPRIRKEQNLIVIEGNREVILARKSGFNLKTLLFCRHFLTNENLSDILLFKGAELIEISREVYARIAYRKESDGIIALARPRKFDLTELNLRPSPLILILESVEKPGNLGALLRTADAAGLDAVIICDPQTDIFNPNSIRSSIGCIFTIPVVIASSEETITFLNQKHITTFATALSATQFYHETDFRQPAAIIMGSEANGLSDQWLKKADNLVKIPMMGKIDSLNVSASAAIVIFEALRQRGFPSHERA